MHVSTRIMLVVTVFCAVTSAYAQQYHGFGLRAGIAFSTFSLAGDWGDAETGWITSPAIALSWRFGLSSHLALQPELGFLRKGGRISSSRYHGGLYTEESMMLQLPLLVIYGVTIGESLLLDIQAGGAVGVNAEGGDASLILGSALHIPLDKVFLLVDLRADLSNHESDLAYRSVILTLGLHGAP